jgi:shikimate kinase
MRADIILIGPIRSGKSTLGRLLAEKLGVPQVSLDEFCWDYYQEIGFDPAAEDAHGPDGMIASRFNAYAVERLLQDHSGCVIDLGAGHSVYRDAPSLERVQKALASYPNVFLILPSPDLEESARVLAERNEDNGWLQSFRAQHGYNPNEHFLRHPSNFALAKHVVYTSGRSPQETCDEILERIECRPTARDGNPLGPRQREILVKLTKALEKAKVGPIRSAILITMQADGRSECWARINADEDSGAVRDYLESLKRDLATRG